MTQKRSVEEYPQQHGYGIERETLLNRHRKHTAGSGWNGHPGRSRRRPAAELRVVASSNMKHPGARGDLTPTAGRVARQNGPVARSTRNSL
jgi:hypothetical protein